MKGNQALLQMESKELSDSNALTAGSGVNLLSSLFTWAASVAP